MPTHRASLGSHLHSPTKNIVEGVAIFHPSNTQHSVIKLLRDCRRHLPCTTHPRRWITPGGRGIDIKLSHCPMSVQRAARSTCSAGVLYIRGSLLKMGASVCLVLGYPVFIIETGCIGLFTPMIPPTNNLCTFMSPPRYNQGAVWGTPTTAPVT